MALPFVTSPADAAPNAASRQPSSSAAAAAPAALVLVAIARAARSRRLRFACASRTRVCIQSLHWAAERSRRAVQLHAACAIRVCCVRQTPSKQLAPEPWKTILGAIQTVLLRFHTVYGLRAPNARGKTRALQRISFKILIWNLTALDIWGTWLPRAICALDDCCTARAAERACR